MMREVMHHGGLKHPFVIDLKEVFLTPEYLAIVMEFAQGGNVSKQSFLLFLSCCLCQAGGCLGSVGGLSAWSVRRAATRVC